MISLALLGNVNLTVDGGAALDAPLRRSKGVMLLAYLAVARPHGFHRRQKIAALFWPELVEDRARAALRTTLARLRVDHGADLILGRGADEISVDASLLRCDVVEFDAAEQGSRFEEAIKLYRGPFLDGVHVEGTGEELESWIAAERSRLRDGMLRALSAVSSAAENRGDLEGAVRAAQEALTVSPNDEILARRVITLLVASGNRGGAMSVHDDLVRRLRTEFGVEPAAETSALVASLRERPPTSADVDERAPVALAILGRDRAPDSEVIPVPAARTRRAFYVVCALALVAVLAGSWIATRNTSAPVATRPFEWQPITPVSRIPTGAFGSQAMLDSTGDALLLLGGVNNVEQKLLVSLGEPYWRLRGLTGGGGASWTRVSLATGPHPSPRWSFGASSDAAHDRVIVYGGALGFTSPCADDAWVLNHASGIGHVPAWQRVLTRGPVPPARAAFDQVYDAPRRRLIVFAGHDCVYPTYHDTWVLAFDDSTLASGTWTLLVPDSSAGVPVARDNYAAAYDTTAARLFIFGGRAAGVPTGELWALDHASGTGGIPAWRPLSCAGESPVLIHPASAFDVASDTWTFFGGIDASGQVTRSVWRIHGLQRDLQHCRWEQLPIADPSPAARASATAALLPRSRGIVVFGGDFVNTPLTDAWVLKPVADHPRR